MFAKILIMMVLVLAITPGIRGLVEEGNLLYADGQYENALTRYQEAQVNAPYSMVIRFNLADALLKLERVDESLNELSRVIASSDTVLAAMASYNTARALTDAGDLETGIMGYVNSLRLNPNDEDAKHNLELLLRQLQSQQQEQQSQEQQQKEQSEEQEQQQEEQQEEQQQEQNQSEDQDEMSEEDAARIMDAVRSEEEKIQEEMNKAKVQTPIQVDKDW